MTSMKIMHISHSSPVVRLIIQSINTMLSTHFYYHLDDHGRLTPIQIPQRKLVEPFPCFDLPTEIRYYILDSLLVRGIVELCRKDHIKERHPDWKHEKTLWQLLLVSRRMHTEAKSLVYSAKNIFYLPTGPRRSNINSIDEGQRPRLPPIKRLDCAFDMRDVAEDSMETYRRAKSNHESANTANLLRFDEFKPQQMWQYIHDLGVEWQSRMSSPGLELDLLRLDFTICSCMT